MTAPKVTIDDLVLVQIERAEDGPPLSGEDGLATRLLMWTISQRIYGIGGHSYTGPDYFSALYRPEDGARVRQWLSEQPEPQP